MLRHSVILKVTVAGLDVGGGHFAKSEIAELNIRAGKGPAEMAGIVASGSTVLFASSNPIVGAAGVAAAGFSNAASSLGRCARHAAAKPRFSRAA